MKENICPNPSFEQLNPAGDNFPIGWNRFTEGNAMVVISEDTHEGTIAIKMTADEKSKCGLNSDFLPCIKGKMSFWYKD